MPAAPRLRHAGGFTLVELLAGMMIALIAFLIMMKLFADSETAKRNVSSGSDAQINGAVALFSLGRELRVAGYGLTADAALGCTLAVHNSERTPTDFTLDALQPVTIFPSGSAAQLSSGSVLPAGDSNSDIVVVVYGSANRAREAVAFNDISAATAHSFQAKNAAVLQLGDLAITAQSGKNCALLQVTALPGSNVVTFGTATFTNVYSAKTGTSAYNQATLPVNYASSGYSATLSNVGAELKILAYAIHNGNLTECNLLTTDCTSASTWSLVAANIVGLKALYGWDTGSSADGQVDAYSSGTPSSLSGKSAQCKTARIGAVQIGLVARNALMDKQNVTSSAPTWQGGTFALDHLSNWTRYRYKVFETIVPLKNIVWKGAISGC